MKIGQPKHSERETHRSGLVATTTKLQLQVDLDLMVTKGNKQ
jgi:hypothetical protein